MILPRKTILKHIRMLKYFPDISLHSPGNNFPGVFMD